MAVNTRLSRAIFSGYTAEIKYISTVPYRESVGALQLCSLICRPNLSYAVNQVAKFNSKPDVLDWEAVRRILLYAYQNKDWGILY